MTGEDALHPQEVASGVWNSLGGHQGASSMCRKEHRKLSRKWWEAECTYIRKVHVIIEQTSGRSVSTMQTPDPAVTEPLGLNSKYMMD